MGLERLDRYDIDRGEAPWQLRVSVCIALAVHMAMWCVFSFQHRIDLKIDVPDYVSVKFITEAEDAPIIPEPILELIPELIIEPPSGIDKRPAPIETSEAIESQEVRPDVINPRPFVGNETLPIDDAPKLIINTPTTKGPIIDEQFRLKNWNGPADKDYQILTAATDCFGFEVKCAAQRKSLFGDLQATAEQRALEQRAPHVGLSAQFYGLSERQIRKKLNVPFAGENGQVIIPGLLQINGPIWDALHGVNKHCENKFSGNGGRGAKFIKDCGSYRRADPNAFKRFEQQRDGEHVPFQNLADKDDVK